MLTEQWFPIQGDRGTDEGRGQHWKRPAGQVPWAVAAAAYKVYARRYGTSQSLEKLAARGGFGWAELTWLLAGAPEDRESELCGLAYAEPNAPTPVA